MAVEEVADVTTGNFYLDMKRFVDQHGAINNLYLDRFSRGGVSDREFLRFAREFYHFSRFFPRILVTQLVNTADEAVAAELSKVLYSELGSGDPSKRHELLYRDFLASVGVDVADAISTPMLPSTAAYIGGMEELYSSPRPYVALGASFGLENMAIAMWDQLIPGLERIKDRSFPDMDYTYFGFHRELEASHEDAMEAAVTAHDHVGVEERRELRDGAGRVLDYLEGFWIGLEARRDDAG